MRIPYTGADFLNPYQALNGPGWIDLDWTSLARSAMTVGRRDEAAVMQYAGYSVLECIYRATMIFANLREGAQGKIVRSAAYDGLDPSEKGAISYFIGLVVAKAYAESKLDVPWLMHLDTYRDQFPVQIAGNGRSRPDLFGRNQDGEWVVVEAKGRSNGLSDSALIKAKAQATLLTDIGGEYPALCVGSVAHFGDGRLCLEAVDPPVDKSHTKPFRLDVASDSFFKRYYEPIRSMIDFRHAEPRTVAGREYLVTYLEAADLTVGLDARLVESPLPTGETVGAGRLSDGMLEIGPDGVLVELGPLWSKANMQKSPQDRRRDG